MVTNSPLAIFAPRRKRCSSAGTASSVCLAASVTTWKPLPLPEPTRSADFIDLICSGVVPQHPPTTCAPAATSLRALLAMYSGEHRYMLRPSIDCGGPPFGFAIRGQGLIHPPPPTPSPQTTLPPPPLPPPPT